MVRAVLSTSGTIEKRTVNAGLVDGTLITLPVTVTATGLSETPKIALEYGAQLIIIRHAKSSWTSGVTADHLRPLNKRGRRDAAGRCGQACKKPLIELRQK